MLSDARVRETDLNTSQEKANCETSLPVRWFLGTERIEPLSKSVSNFSRIRSTRASCQGRSAGTNNEKHLPAKIQNSLLLSVAVVRNVVA
jgi:hypothetical protein